MAELDPNAVSITGLMLTARTLSLMVSKGVAQQGEAEDVIREVFRDIGNMNLEIQAQAKSVLAIVFPSVDLDAKPARARSTKLQ